MIKADFSASHFMAKTIKKMNPSLWHLLCPRHVVPPGGYAHPRVLASLMGSQLEICLRVSAGDPSIKCNKTVVDCILMSWSLAEAGMPTYFVDKDIMADLAQSDTDGISDMRLNELEWPHEAMAFMLPESFQEKFFGRPVPFVAVCRIDIGLKRPPECVQRALPYRITNFGIASDEDHSYGDSKQGYVFYAPSFFKNGKSVDYAGSWPIESKVGEVTKECFFLDGTHGNVSKYLPSDEVPTHQEDLDLMNKIFSTTLWLMLLLNDQPEQIERGEVTCVRKSEAHEPKGINDLWSPTTIGRPYARSRVDFGGTHASPRAHTRRAHWTQQPHGPGRTLRKAKWIKRMMIGVKGAVA